MSVQVTYFFRSKTEIKMTTKTYTNEIYNEVAVGLLNLIHLSKV